MLFTQGGCSSSPSVSDKATNNMNQPIESQNINSITEDEQKFDFHKYEKQMEEWEEMKKSIQRLTVIEAELTDLIGYLSDLAEKNKIPDIQKVQQNILVTPANVIPSPKTHSYALQLAAVTKQSQIKTVWVELTSKHPKILAPLESTYEKSLVNNKTYYRIKAGDFTKKADATALCKQLVALETTCIVSPYNGTTF